MTFIQCRYDITLSSHPRVNRIKAMLFALHSVSSNSLFSTCFLVVETVLWFFSLWRCCFCWKIRTCFFSLLCLL